MHHDQVTCIQLVQVQKVDHLKLFFPTMSRKKKIQITKDSFTTIYAALTDVTRTSEAAQTASDVYVKIDRQEEDRAAGPTSLTNIQTSK